MAHRGSLSARQLRVIRLLLRRALRILWRLSFVLAVMALIGALYQTIGGAIDAGRHPAPGRMVDAGGHRLHLLCSGHGTPTVVLESGLTGSASSWALVQPGVARTTRVCAYDRAGYGWSDAGPIPRTADRIVGDLRDMLRSSGLTPPYILVGQSFGGMTARLFAYRYPHLLAGLVQVDASYEDQWTPGEGNAAAQILGPCRVAAEIGLLSLGTQLGLLPHPESGTFYRPAWCAAVFGELAVVDKSAREVRAARHSLGHLPLVVLTRSFQQGLSPQQEAFEQRWQRWQLRLARLSTDSRHIVVAGSGHNIQTDRPAAVIGAIRSIVTAVRHHQPLTRLSHTAETPRLIAHSPHP
jgi:pimeloyl-ACP methyl ester carboxylesterase